MYKISFYLILPASVIVLLIVFLHWKFSHLDIEKSVNLAATLIQTMAIFVGGLWAYHKFGWEKRAESAIKIKAMLMQFEQRHSEAALQYTAEKVNNIDWLKCWLNYSMLMIPAYNEFLNTVHLSSYLPKKIRQKIFDTVFLPLNKGKSPKTEDLRKNWEIFGNEIKKIKQELDDFASK